MARPLLFQADQHASTCHNTVPLLALLAAVAAVAAVLVSLCTSSKHAKLWKQRGSPSAPQLLDGGASRNQLRASLSGIGGKAAALAKLVSWNRRSPPGGSSSDDDEAAVAAGEDALWTKTIMMGDKCRPLEFSGHIAYDSEGNQLPPPPPAIKEAAADAAKN